MLGLAIAALDALCKLDFLRRREQRVTSGLAQEELQRVGRRLPGDRSRRRLGRRRELFLRQQLDAAGLELAVDAFELERIEAQLLAGLGQFRFL